jgi:DNA-binding beta-propeller fold protein YncE
VAGGGSKSPLTADGGPATEARLIGGPTGVGLAVDGVGNLFIAQGFDHRVRKVSPDGIITTVAIFGTPHCVAVDSAGNLFISDLNSHRVRKVTPEGVTSTVAGTGEATFSGDGGPAVDAGLRGPMGLAIDAAGNLFVADTAWWTYYFDPKATPSERVLEVVGVAAPGLIAGKPFPKQ